MSRFDTFWATSDAWQHSAFVAILLAALFQSVFISVYLTRPWWRHFVGRALALKSTSLLIVLWLTIVNTFFRYPGQEQVSTIALWLVAFAVVYQLIALLLTPRIAYPPDDRTSSDD